MTYSPVAPGDLAAVVTFLEMRQRPDIAVPPAPLSLRRMERPAAADYRDLFRLIGSPWLWFSRLVLDDQALDAITHDPRVELYKVEDEAGRPSGMLELDFRAEGECELAFVGLIPELSGHGHGRWLLAESIDRAWRSGIDRVHVHTCSLDHPAALGAYRRAGFIPYKRAVETFPDPRLSGILAADCAPQIPLVGASTVSRPDN